MNIIYEISKRLIPLKYEYRYYMIVLDATGFEKRMEFNPMHMTRDCSRVWVEDNISVFYWSYGSESLPNIQVDLEEFMWIKLKCHLIT